MSGYDGRGTKFPLTICRGADMAFALTVTDTNGTAVNMSAATIAGEIYTTAGTLVDTMTAVVSGGSSNIITLSFTDTETTAFTLSRYDWTLWITRGSDKRPWLAGRVNVTDGTSGTSSTSGDATLTVDGDLSVAITVSGAGYQTAADHIADTVDAHDASAISILDTGGYYTATTVEAALAELPSLYAPLVSGGMSVQSELSSSQGVGSVTALTIPTYEASGVCTHPSVVLFENGWNGYNYWMAFTPYPGQDSAYENPSIVASLDGVTWEVPAGLTNPIDPYPGALSYNSDTHLVLGRDGYLYCFWRQFLNSATLKERIYFLRSLDGVTWGDKTLIWSTDHTVQRLMSPALIEEVDGSWRMFAIDIIPSPNNVVTTTASTLTGTWAATTTVTGVSVGAGRDPWHIDAHKIGGEYVLLVDDATLGASGTEGDLYRAVSRTGTAFTTDVLPLAAVRRHYRTSFLPATVNGYNGYEVYYGNIDSISRGFVITDGAARRQDDVTLMTAACTPRRPYVFGDSVVRVDSAASPGTSTSGIAWSAFSGTWGVSSNALYVTTDTNGKVRADILVSDVEFGFTVKIPPSSGGSLWVMARAQDTNNYWRLGNETATWKIQSIVAGAVSVDVTTAGRNLVAGDTLRAVVSGTSIKLYVNGFLVLSTTSASFQTQTQFGIQTSKTATRVTDIYAKTP
jgi:hypothetical protein